MRTKQAIPPSDAEAQEVQTLLLEEKPLGMRLLTCPVLSSLILCGSFISPPSREEEQNSGSPISGIPFSYVFFSSQVFSRKHQAIFQEATLMLSYMLPHLQELIFWSSEICCCPFPFPSCKAQSDSVHYHHQNLSLGANWESSGSVLLRKPPSSVERSVCLGHPEPKPVYIVTGCMEHFCNSLLVTIRF